MTEHQWCVRGIRGAITADENTDESILKATKELLQALITRNDFIPADICSIIFSTTSDLDAQFPALAARELGWMYVPLLCTNEIPVQGSLGKCIRVLIHVNTTKHQDELYHLYLKGAAVLRPDLKSPLQQYQSE